MEFFWHGLGLGLALSVLVGPIFIALTQTGMEKGAREGLMVGSGIWTSDIVVILGGYFFIKEIQNLISDPVFFQWLGFTGGIILMITGIATIMKKPVEQNTLRDFGAKTLLGYWTKGFSVNFFNPFTFVFWLGVMSSYVVGKSITTSQSVTLFGTIMITIMITDSLKVLFGKFIRTRMTPDKLIKISYFAGVALCVFGIVLIFRSS